jgi:hypothetical protein
VPSGATVRCLKWECSDGASPVEQGDLVGPGRHYQSRREDVEVVHPDPVSGHVRVLEVGPPDLPPRGRVHPRDVRTRKDRRMRLRQVAAAQEQLPRLPGAEERDPLVFVLAAPREDLVRLGAGACEGSVRKAAAALCASDLGAVQRRVVARGGDLGAAPVLPLDQAMVPRQGAVRGLLVVGQAAPGQLTAPPPRTPPCPCSSSAGSRGP